MRLFKYRIVIEPDTGGTWHGYAPALRGCHTWGDSVEETKEHLKEAISVYIESLEMDGLPIPEDQGCEEKECLESHQAIFVAALV